jgi:hypothetical protein
VRERRSGCRARAADLETDDGLSGRGAPSQRVDEGVRPPHSLHEQSNGPGLAVGGEEAEEVCDVRHGLGTRRDDGTEPDAAAEVEQRLGDRARLADGSDAAGRDRVGNRADPRAPAWVGGAHAVRAEEDGAELAAPRRETLGGRAGGSSCLVAEARDDERSHPDCGGVLEGLLDPLMVDEQQRRLGRRRQVGHAREARQPEHLVSVRVHSEGRNAAREGVAHRCGMSGRRADDDERVWKQERADVGHDEIFPHATRRTPVPPAADGPRRAGDYRVPATWRR